MKSTSAMVGSFNLVGLHIPVIKDADHLSAKIAAITRLVRLLCILPSKQGRAYHRAGHGGRRISAAIPFMRWSTPASVWSCSTTCPPVSRTALPHQLLPIVGDVGDQTLAASLIKAHDIDAIIHFAGSIIVPESVGIRSSIIATTPPSPRPDRRRGQRRRPALHLQLDRGDLRRPRGVPIAEDIHTAPVSPMAGRS